MSFETDEEYEVLLRERRDILVRRFRSTAGSSTEDAARLEEIDTRLDIIESAADQLAALVALVTRSERLSVDIRSLIETSTSEDSCE